MLFVKTEIKDVALANYKLEERLRKVGPCSCLVLRSGAAVRDNPER